MDDGVELGVDCLDALNSDFEQFQSADLAFFDQVGEAKGIVAAVFFKVHGQMQ